MNYTKDEKIREKVEKVLDLIIVMIWGFHPTLQSEWDEVGLRIIVDTEAGVKGLLVGSKGENFSAVRHLMKIWCRRNDVRFLISVYVKSDKYIPRFIPDKG